MRSSREAAFPTSLGEAESAVLREEVASVGHKPRFIDKQSRRLARAAKGIPRRVLRRLGTIVTRILEHGLARLQCGVCGQEMVVAYSCKRRGFCPSCIGRRMSDVAAHLVDEILPEVPMRHWICSLQWRLRCSVGFDRHLCADVLRAFSGALDRSLRRRAKKALGLRSVEQAITGAVIFIQRGDSALRMNSHCANGAGSLTTHEVRSQRD